MAEDLEVHLCDKKLCAQIFVHITKVKVGEGETLGNWAAFMRQFLELSDKNSFWKKFQFPSKRKIPLEYLF